MDYHTIIKDIQARKFSPIYFLMGEEGYFIDEITLLLEKTVLSEQEKAFNQLVLYGKETTIEEVISAARRYPMMAPYQVVLVKEAQHLKNIEMLSMYVENPMTTTILVIAYRGKTLDKRKSLTKKLTKSFVLFSAKRLYDNKVPAWINQRMEMQGYTISPKAGVMLVEYLGTDLSKINNELKKLCLVLPKGTYIDAIHIEQNIGISKDYNVFELQKALGGRDTVKAMKIVKYFAANPKNNPLVKLIPILYPFFVKILRMHYLSKKETNPNNLARAIGVNVYFIQDYRIAMQNYSIKQVVDAISLFREYDMKSKGMGNVSASDGELLNELVWKIFYL